MNTQKILVGLSLLAFIFPASVLAGDQVLDLSVGNLSDSSRAHAFIDDLHNLPGIRNVDVDWSQKVIHLEIASGSMIDGSGITEAFTRHGFSLGTVMIEAEGTVGEELDTTYFFLPSGQGLLIRRNSVVNDILERTEGPVRVKGRVTRLGQRDPKDPARTLDPFLTILNYTLPEKAEK